jgi:hypothetical protein
VITRQYWDWLPVGVEGEQTLSVLFCASWRKKEPKNAVGKVSRLRARRGHHRLSFRCWTSQKPSIRVASETLKSMTTFTRHHAFLKKAGENFHEWVVRVVAVAKKRPPSATSWFC